MKLTDFDFDLPESLIATRPAHPRSSARLLLAEGDVISDRIVSDLPAILRPGDLLVLNDTKVIPARLSGTRSRKTAQGLVKAHVAVMLLEPVGAGEWQALAKPLRKLQPGDTIRFTAALAAEVIAVEDGTATLRFDAEGDAFDDALDAAGMMPLPPYIASKRAPDAQDRTDYQTVWAARSGAVAAPTASLHFDEPLLAALAARGVETAKVTLHVGAGTFLPVKVENIDDHHMHSERGEVTATAATAIGAARAEGRRVIAVGTTALRVIEAAAGGGAIAPFHGATDIFIKPGYHFRVTDALMTNFHLPQSTLLMLVSALMGRARIQHIYQHAIASHYRFFSYGDASLLIP